MSSLVASDVAGVGLQYLMWALAGATGGALAILLATAVGKTYRRRHRTPRPRPPRALTSDPARPAEPAAAGEAMPPDPHSPRASPVSADGAPTTRSRLAPGSAVLGYLTVASGRGTGDEDDSATAIQTACERSGWKLIEVVRDHDEGATLDRAGLRNALERITEGEAQGLVVNDVVRLSRSIIDLGALMAWFREAHATLIALDLDIDTSTPEGEHVATTLIALSARDHQRIASGTRRGLAEGRAAGRSNGRPAVSQRPDLVERIAAMRAADMTLSAIAEQLNAEGVPTLRGGKKWRPSSIQAALGYRRPDRGDPLPSPDPRARGTSRARE
jgi:DNA invertase Pin-like site-specific DNA recombinase